MKNILSKTMRIISIPPILISSLLLSLYFNKNYIYRNTMELFVSIFLLGLIPILAYPIYYLVPNLRKQGRRMQRTMAFIITLFGYIFGFIWGYLTKVSYYLQHILLTYALSVIILSITNVLHIKASGHACSTIGVLLYSVYFYGFKFIPFVILFFILVTWSSIYLKRHTLKEIIIGSIICIIAFCISCIFIQ